jgi:hypothetical protein
MAALVLIALLYCGLRAYTGYLAHRAVSLLAEAARIQVGATEESILPLVARYGGVKWKPYSPIPANDCADKAGCEYHNAHLPDYAYDVAFAPFNVLSEPNRQTGRLRRAITALMIETPSSWRDPFSLRDWLIEVQICIRSGRVEKVYGSLFVEGRTRWLGNTWELFADARDHEMGPKTHQVDGTALTFPGNGGGGILQFLTPAATATQLQAAHSFNSHCLTGVIPCRRLCDLSPRTFQYLNEHPEVGNIVATDDCISPKNP